MYMHGTLDSSVFLGLSIDRFTIDRFTPYYTFVYHEIFRTDTKEFYSN